MKNLSKGIIMLVVIAATILSFLYLLRTTANPFASPTSVSESNWLTYQNTPYHYELRYPPNGSVGAVQEEERAISTESSHVAISWVGNAQAPVVIRFIPLPRGSQLSEREQILTLAPEKIAEYGRQAEVNFLAENKNTYNVKLHPTELIIKKIGDRPAFGFQINGYSDAWPLGGFEGPSLNAANIYLVFENSKADKFIIAYPANDPIAQKIVGSFKFTD